MVDADGVFIFLKKKGGEFDLTDTWSGLCVSGSFRFGVT